MSSILKKKILANNGIPPSITAWSDFWTGLEAGVSAWVEETFPGAAEPQRLDRTVAKSDALMQELEGRPAIICGTQSGLSALTIDNRCARAYAAGRLGDDPDSMDAVSDLLVKLICDDRLKALQQHVCDAITFTNAPTQSEIFGGDLALLSTQFGEEPSFLFIVYEFSNGTLNAAISLCFALDQLTEFARQAQSFQPAAGSNNGPQNRLHQTVLASNVETLAVLQRCDLKLADCIRMEPGQIIPLEEADPDQLTLSIQTVQGEQDIAEGELGAWKHSRALKLKTPIKPSFLMGLRPDRRGSPKPNGAPLT